MYFQTRRLIKQILDNTSCLEIFISNGVAYEDAGDPDCYAPGLTVRGETKSGESFQRSAITTFGYRVWDGGIFKKRGLLKARIVAAELRNYFSSRGSKVFVADNSVHTSN